MIKVLSISTDRNIFKEGSAVRLRQIEYGTLFDELHIVVFTKLTSFLPTKIQIGPNVWVYGTHSLSKLLYIGQAVKIAGQIISDHKLTPENSVVTVQDPFETGLVGLKIKKKFGLPLQVQIHTDFLSPFFAKESVLNRLRVRISKKVLLQADAVRTVSRKIAKSLSSTALRIGVVPDVLPIFVDTAKIENTPITVDLRKKYPQFNFTILVASRLTKEKNIPLAIKTFALLLEKYPKTGLVIVGSGGERRSLHSLARSLGVQKSVVFEPWQNDMTTYFKTANVFLLTSNYEGYGLTLIEAIASHCPIVTTDVGIASELLNDGEICFVCPVGDVTCFYSSISRFIENPGYREKCVYEAKNLLGHVAILDKKDYKDRYKESLEKAQTPHIMVSL